MLETDVYNIIRAEIITNHVLMHLFTLTVVIILFTGICVVERHQTILSVFLPLLTLAWGAAIVRFDFFVHRQAKFLRVLEAHIIEKSGSVPLWESWKFSSTSPAYIIPIADIIAFAVILVPTLYLLFNKSPKYFEANQIKGGKLYAWGVTAILFLLLLSLAIIPTIV